MFWSTHDFMKAAGYEHYEISNYAKKGYGSKHNSSYWDLTPYIGVGLGASSYYGGCRYKNITDMDAYIEADGSLELIRELEQAYKVTSSLEEVFFLGLRRLQGVNLRVIREHYEEVYLAPYKEIIERLVKEDLLIIEGDYLRLSNRGIDISNQVMSQFIL